VRADCGPVMAEQGCPYLVAHSNAPERSIASPAIL